MNLLEVRNICKTYGSGETSVKALKDVSFSVPRGEYVAVVGESGSGKSTLLNMIGALDIPTSGKVLIDGKDIFSMNDRKLTVFRRRNIGFIFQAFNLIPELTVEQNHIDFHVSADISEPLPMEKTDISAVFGNALDNALEEVKKLPESQRRVSLEARQGKGILAVSVRNQGRLPDSEKEERRKQNPGIRQFFPSTTKCDTKNHGLGIPSIQAALKKYDGMLELRQEGEEVCLLICCYIRRPL